MVVRGFIVVKRPRTLSGWLAGTHTHPRQAQTAIAAVCGLGRKGDVSGWAVSLAIEGSKVTDEGRNERTNEGRLAA